MRKQFQKNLYPGLWAEIIPALAPKWGEAVLNRPRHVPCPVHGGVDGLRCFDDFDITGGMICNTCGPYPNGFLVLSWALGKPTKEVAHKIRKYTKERKYSKC